jgi:hypothetical protein
MSSVRMDNYVYTEQGLRTAWQFVRDDGYMFVHFAAPDRPWLRDRIYYTIARATGYKPYMFLDRDVGYLIPKEKAQIDVNLLARYQKMEPSAPLGGVRTTSDDWPFLYLQPGAFPTGYVTVFAIVLLIAVAGIWACFGRGGGGRFDPTLFFLGAAFMLLETRGLTAMALLCGSTWMVSSLVVLGILAVALTSNLFVHYVRPTRPGPWFVLLILSSLVLWSLEPAWLNRYPLLLRTILGGILNGLPVGFAGVLFSMFLRRSEHSEAALGANVLGAVLGGSLDYLSTLLGLRNLVLLSMGFYALAAWFALTGRSDGADATPASTESH